MNFWNYLNRYSNVVSRSREARAYRAIHKLYPIKDKRVTKDFKRTLYSMLKRRIERIEQGKYPFYVSRAA